ncbi:helix-hairpin-helix domain-containing protein [Jeotgalibacillus terrae]|uniref:Helix-hairpin-helix domain-containing protein n=1 Tax=Jeotgalibacillus terrae TaxID=587735 RepID=A0ABW5ZGC9_9BACL|nr:helix-hairpin-helix domain-containing protein [Jeotgalibacillus terrae]MBM7577716.1 competence protein ComEA [Jeotgalibacillus terrae]
MLLWLKNHQKYIFILIPLIFISIFLFFQSSQNTTPISSPLNESPSELKEEAVQGSAAEADIIFVDIKGAIKRSGVYEMNNGDRVIDLVEQAGGELPAADMTAVNMAQKLFDEMVIIIPEKISEEAVNQAVQSDKININVATSTELETIPGIGPSKAAAIIQYREENGYFKSIEDMMNISGIGEKTFEQLKEFISTF